MRTVKTLLLVIYFGFLPFLLLAQVKTIKHTYYTVTYSVPEHIPTLVKYVLKKGMGTCTAKRVGWKADPLLDASDVADDYFVGCGYQKGHNMPHQNNSCNTTGVTECFYYTNCFPQTAALNNGPWKVLEGRERDYADKYGQIKVFIGHIGRKHETLGVNKLTIPAYCWKVIYVNKKFEAYIFPNTEDPKGRKPEEFMSAGNLKKIEQDNSVNFLSLLASVN